MFCDEQNSLVAAISLFNNKVTWWQRQTEWGWTWSQALGWGPVRAEWVDTGQLTCTGRALEGYVVRVQRWAGGTHRRSQRLLGRVGLSTGQRPCGCGRGTGSSVGRDESQGRGLCGQHAEEEPHAARAHSQAVGPLLST